MKNLLFLIVLSISFLGYSQETVRVKFETGDKELNTHLRQINDYAKSNMDSFRKDMSDKFGVTKELLDQLITRDRYEPADVYYGYNLAQVTRRPFATIMQMHTDKKGWGSIAKDLGIKPGSKEFHALKNGTLKNIGKDRFNDKGKKKTDNKKSKLHKEQMKQSDKKMKVDYNQMKNDNKKIDQKVDRPKKEK